MTFSSDRLPANPVFVEINPEITRRELLETAIALLGKEIYPAQVESLLIDLATYCYTLAQTDFQYTGEQSLVNYATGSNLEQLAALLGVARATPSPALTTFSFTLSTAQTFSLLIPLGTRIKSKDNLTLWETTAALTIPAGATTGMVQGKCQTVGTVGNTYQAGDISILVDPVPYVSTVTNTTIATGGSDIESDDRLRVRAKLAPASFSVAGSEDSYKYWALSASPFIRDVSVISPDPNAVISNLQALINGVSTAVQNLAAGATLAQAKTAAATQAATNSALVQQTVAPLAQAQVFVLTNTGLPSAEVLTLVANTLNAQKIRPLTDQVFVQAPIPIDYNVSIDVTVYNFANGSTVREQALAEVRKITDDWGSRLGADIEPTALISALVPVRSQPNSGVFGIARCLVTSPVYTAVAVNQWARLGAVTINIVGTTTG